MTPIHRQHLESSYLQEVRYEPTTDTEGQPDWLMYYTPGPKARAEYETFNRRRLIKAGSLDTEPEPRKPESRGEVIAQNPDPLEAPIVKILQYFQKEFWNVETVHPTTKEINQVKVLLTEYSLNLENEADFRKAQHIITFSKTLAPETNYKPQTFGGLFPYIPRALADYDQRIQAEKINLLRQEKEQQERERREKERQELNDFYQRMSDVQILRAIDRGNGLIIIKL